VCHIILFLPGFALPLFWILPFKTALPLYVLVVAISFLFYFKIFQAMRQRVKTGREAMVGKRGFVIADINPEGKVQYASEIWDAITKGGARFFQGEQVTISGIRGLTLIVEGFPTKGDVMLKTGCH
jgi:membrane protein implicated in regulation of membrane protease activity